MSTRKTPGTPPDIRTLGAREREILEILFAATEASVAEVRERLTSPPTYSAVRGMLRLLEEKGLVTHRRDGLRYVYAPAMNSATARTSALRAIVDTFFRGRPEHAVAALLELPDDSLRDVDTATLRQLILKAKSKGK